MPSTAWFTRPTGRSRIEVPQAFGTGQGDDGRWSAQAGMDTAGGAGGDRWRDFHGVAGSRRLWFGEACGLSEFQDDRHLAQSEEVLGLRGLRSGWNGGGHQLFRCEL